MKAGLNLFSIRTYLQTEGDFIKTAQTLKEYGYSYMQFSGSPLKADAIARVVKESDMPVYLTHSPYNRIIDDTDKLMEEHASFGCKNIGLGALPDDSRYDGESCKSTIEKLERVAEKMEVNGFKFFYHHHAFEFYKLFGNETTFDYMIKNAPHVNFTADTYWLQYGGVDILSFLEKIKGRIGCVHLKDMKQIIDEKAISKPHFAAIGDGVIDFKRIVEKMKTLGTQYYFVEQDDAAEISDGMEQVARSMKVLKEI